MWQLTERAKNSASILGELLEEEQTVCLAVWNFICAHLVSESHTVNLQCAYPMYHLRHVQGRQTQVTVVQVTNNAIINQQ